jgi:hypothetical protein
LSGAALWAWNAGWFKLFLLVEAIVVVGLYLPMRASLASVRWDSME